MGMPDSYGKRQRREVKAKKAAAREERRVARNQRQTDRASGALADEPIGPAQPVDTGDDIVINEYGVIVSGDGDGS